MTLIPAGAGPVTGVADATVFVDFTEEAVVVPCDFASTGTATECGGTAVTPVLAGAGFTTTVLEVEAAVFAVVAAGLDAATEDGLTGAALAGTAAGGGLLGFAS